MCIRDRGNAVNAVTELILAGALLVKNCLGAMAVVVLLLAGAGPVIHYGLLSLSYRFLGAVAQPVSDKRIVGCLGTMGEGLSLIHISTGLPHWKHIFGFFLL